METIIKLSGNKNYLLDLTNRRITCLDSRWYYTEEGNPVPSVTTILDAYPKNAAYYEWLKRMGHDSDDIRNEAGRKGSNVHDLTERYDKGEEVSLLNGDGDINMSIKEWLMFSRFVEFRDRFPSEVISIEQNIVSAKLGYAGTLDRIIKIKDKRILLDIKTANSIYPHYWLQLAAYENLLTDMHGYNSIDLSGILWLNAKVKTDGKKGTIQGNGWQLLLMADEDKAKYKKLFENTFALWKEEHSGEAPKQVSYQLSFKKSISQTIKTNNNGSD